MTPLSNGLQTWFRLVYGTRKVQGRYFPVCKGSAVAVPNYKSSIALQALCLCFAAPDSKTQLVLFSRITYLLVKK